MKPATTAAEYAERTHDENKARELHPSDLGRIDLDTFQLLTSDGRRAVWAAASDADRRGLALQIIRRQNHGPDEATIVLYLEELDRRFGPSPIERAVMGALERLALQEAESARGARASGEAEDARFFQRAANAYTKALCYYRDGIRPEPLPSGGYTLPSQRPGEAPHLLTLDGDWLCSCPAGESMHWAKALIIGIEVAYEELGQLDDTTEADRPAAPTDLGERLAAARARLIDYAA